MIPADATPGADEIGAPELPHYTGSSKVPATFHGAHRDDCECDGYPGTRVCGCWRQRPTPTEPRRPQ